MPAGRPKTWTTCAKDDVRRAGLYRHDDRWQQCPANDVGHGSSSARPCTTIATCLTRIPPTRIPTTIATRRRKLRKRSGPALHLINQARYYMDGPRRGLRQSQCPPVGRHGRHRARAAGQGGPRRPVAASLLRMLWRGRRLVARPTRTWTRKSEAQSKKAASALRKGQGGGGRAGDLALGATRATPTTRTTSARSSCRTTRGRNKKGWVGGREGGERARVW